MKLIILFAGMMLCGLGCAQRLIVPAQHAEIVIGDGTYVVDFNSGLMGPVREGEDLRIEPVASEVTCGDVNTSGVIEVSSDLLPQQQAKALIQEVVHIAQTCDKRDLPVDERIAQDIADLLNSSEGSFVMRELAQ